MLNFDLMECQALATAVFLRFLSSAGSNGLMLVTRVLNESGRSEFQGEDEAREIGDQIRAILDDSLGPEKGPRKNPRHVHAVGH
jgi:hypothetical protein